MELKHRWIRKTFFKAVARNRHSIAFMISQLTAATTAFHYWIPLYINLLPVYLHPSMCIREFRTSNTKLIISSKIAISMEL
jgi:hypothetical protein